MSAKEVTRTYNFEDARLSSEAARIKKLVIRDAKEFKTRNVGDKDTDALQQAADAFDNYATDEELLGTVTDSTAAKDAVVAELKTLIRPIRNMAETQYKNGGKYRSFGFKDMDSMDDNNLYRLALRVVRVGNKLMPELSARGLTAETLTAISGKAGNLHDALEAMAETVEDRDIATQERIELGNALYAIVVELASIGKSLFEDTDEARYNDYVLYNEPGAGSAPVTPAV